MDPLRDLNEILRECGEPETTLEELERHYITLVDVDDIDKTEPVRVVSAP